MALKESGVKDASVVAAFDINTFANQVYEHNHGLKPMVTNVEHLPVEFYDRLAADCWLMSPPCQPFTRGGKQRDDQDARSMGLLYLIDMLAKLKQPPRYLFLENVLNFEVSECRRLLVEQLQRLGYRIEEWLVSPKDLGLPNDRLRYYLLAARSETSELLGIYRSFAEVGEPVPTECRRISEFLIPAADQDTSLLVPLHYLTEYKNYRHDITLPSSQHSTTFTKAYGSKYIIGTGSFIPTQPISETELRRDDPTQLVQLGLRFFSPAEIAALHGFPADFSFPTALPRIQQYRLLGNSMSVPVVTRLLSRLFSLQ